MISNIRSGAADSIKTDGLDPHEIATKVYELLGLDVEFLQATWDEKVFRKYHERIETIKAKMLEGFSRRGYGETHLPLHPQRHSMQLVVLLVASWSPVADTWFNDRRNSRYP